MGALILGPKRRSLTTRLFHPHYPRGNTMKKVIVALFGLASATLLGTASPAGAANINTPGAACHAFFTDQQASVNYVNVGMSVGASMVAQCPIPRGPLATGATTGSFFVDGQTPASASTSCTVVSYNFDGTTEGSVAPAGDLAAYTRRGTSSIIWPSLVSGILLLATTLPIKNTVQG